MVLRILVVEDMKVSYDFVMRELAKILSMENFEFTNVKTIPTALDALEQDWDAILMDYYLGLQYGKRGESRFEHGAHLVAYRRELEKAESEKKKVRIIGFSGSDLRNNDMMNAGATCCFLKHDEIGLAGALEALVKQ